MNVPKWSTRVLPALGLVIAGTGVFVIVVVATAKLGLSDQLRAQLIAGAGLGLVLLLMFATGPKHYTAINDVPAAPPTDEPMYKRNSRLTKAQYDALPAEQQELVESQRGMLFRSLYVGVDGRWSTSKVQSLMWTLIFVYTLVTIFIADQIGLKFNEDVTFGTLTFPDNYLLLLGGPYAALVAAKGITSSQSDQKTTDDTSPADKSVAQGLREVVGDDDGNADLGDFQFFLFNLIAVAVFLVLFVPDVQAGLPVLPDYLVALTSASALGYLGKKAFGAQTPSITAILPVRVRPAGMLTIHGTGLTVGTRTPIVTIDGMAADEVKITRVPRTASDGVQLTAKVPVGVAAGAGKTVSVRPTGDVAAATGTIEVVDTELTSDPDPVVWTPSAGVTLNGSELLAPGNNSQVVVRIGGTSLENVDVTSTRIRGTLPQALDPAVPPSARLPLRVTLADGTEVSGSVAVAIPRIMVTSVAPTPVVVAAGAATTIAGTAFGPQPAMQADGTVELGGQRLAWTAWTDTSIVASLPAADTAELTALTALKGTSVPLVAARLGRTSGALAVQLSP
jgi:hypothetical protein